MKKELFSVFMTKKLIVQTKLTLSKGIIRYSLRKVKYGLHEKNRSRDQGSQYIRNRSKSYLDFKELYLDAFEYSDRWYNRKGIQKRLCVPTRA